MVGWQCCAPESWAFWASGEWRERFVKNGRPRAASMLEQTQPYHEVCGMCAWQAWALDNKLSFHDHHHPEPLPRPLYRVRLYVYTLSNSLPRPSAIGRGEGQPGRTRLRPGRAGRRPLAVASARAEGRELLRYKLHNRWSPCAIFTPTPAEPLCPRRPGGGPKERVPSIRIVLTQ